MECKLSNMIEILCVEIYILHFIPALSLADQQLNQF